MTTTLQMFETGFNFRGEDARYDKVEVNITFAHTCSMDVDRINESFQAIAENSEYLRYEENEYSPKLKIRSTSSNRDSGSQPLLFSGEVRAIKDRGSNGYNIKAYLNINPTKYFAHNPGHIHYRSGINKLFANEAITVQSCLKSINQNSNYIFSERLGEASRIDWEEHTREYLDLIFAYLRDEMNAHGEGIEYTLPSCMRWRIKSIELYWEKLVGGTDAQSITNHFGEYVKKQTLETDINYYLNKITNHYSRSYVFGTEKQNQKIAIYAKSNSRVRIEYRYTDFQRNDEDDISTQDYSDRSYEAMFELMDELRDRAVERLQLLVEIKDGYDARDRLTSMQMTDALNGLAWILNQSSKHTLKLSRSLLDTGKVTDLPEHPDYTDFIKALEARGLIRALRKKPSHPRQYVLTGNLLKLINKLPANIAE